MYNKGVNTMNFSHLEYAMTVAECRSINKAARKLLVSQPYLSGVLKNLEEELGCQLFKRSHNGILLTEKGERFMDSARTILYEYEKLKQLSCDEAVQPMEISSYFVSNIMRLFLEFKKQSGEQLPDRLTELGNQEVIESVAAGRTRLGFILCAAEKKDKYLRLVRDFHCSCEELMTSIPLYVMVSNEHPLYKKASVSMKELLDYPYVHFNDVSAISYLKLVGLADHPNRLEVDNRGQFFDAIREGQYISLSVRGKTADGRGFCFVPISDKNLYLNLYFVTQADYRLNKREREFIRFLRDFAALDGQKP